MAIVGFGATASADPKPIPVDIKPFKDKLQVFQDAKGGTYAVVVGTTEERQMFYGANIKVLYQQRLTGYSADGEAHTWGLSAEAPRLKNMQHGSISRRPDGTYLRQCDERDDMVLAELTGDKAKAIVDKAQFLTPAAIYVPVLLARDDSGVYYYVDRLSKIYGGKGYRVWIGRKGGMKTMPLTDVADDTAGQVFATKSGDLRLVQMSGQVMPGAQWIKGGKKESLISLDLDMNSPLIYSDLGIYTFLGTLCDNVSY